MTDGIYIGIDPGVHGSVAGFRPHSDFTQYSASEPATNIVRVGKKNRTIVTPSAMWAALDFVIGVLGGNDVGSVSGRRSVRVSLERVQPMPIRRPGMRVPVGRRCGACGEIAGQMPPTSAFTFGETMGAWKAILELKGLPYDLVHPVSWKRKFGLLGQTKDAAIVTVQRELPGAVLRTAKDHARADAYLLALYAQRLNGVA